MTAEQISRSIIDGLIEIENADLDVLESIYEILHDDDSVDSEQICRMVGFLSAAVRHLISSRQGS